MLRCPFGHFTAEVAFALAPVEGPHYPHTTPPAPRNPPQIACIGSSCMLWSTQGQESGKSVGRCALGTRLIQDPAIYGPRKDGL